MVEFAWFKKKKNLKLHFEIHQSKYLKYQTFDTSIQKFPLCSCFLLMAVRAGKDLIKHSGHATQSVLVTRGSKSKFLKLGEPDILSQLLV